MEYSKYLKSSKWERLRDRAIKRAKNKCQLCSGDKNLQVHHRTYQRLFNESLVDLTVLCERCHKHFHNILPKYKEPILVNIPDRPQTEIEKKLESNNKILLESRDDELIKKALRENVDLARQQQALKQLGAVKLV